MTAHFFAKVIQAPDNAPSLQTQAITITGALALISQKEGHVIHADSRAFIDNLRDSMDIYRPP